MKSASPLPRRAFLAQLTVLGLAGLTCAGKWTGWFGRGPHPRPQTALSLEKATCADFAQCVGTTFRIHPEPGEQLRIKLVEARELRSRARLAPGMRQPFSLIFWGEPSRALGPQIYQVEHPRLGTLAMYLGPVNRPASGVYLEAVFG